MVDFAKGKKNKIEIFGIVFALLCIICLAFLVIDLYLIWKSVELDKNIQILIDAIGKLK